MAGLEMRLAGLSISVTWPAAFAILFVTTTSGKALLLKLPARIASGLVPAPGSIALAKRPLPGSAKTVTVPTAGLVTAMPPVVDWARSAITTPLGAVSGAKGDCDAATKGPSPFPRYTERE